MIFLLLRRVLRFDYAVDNSLLRRSPKPNSLIRCWSGHCSISVITSFATRHGITLALIQPLVAEGTTDRRRREEQ